jgi:predicted ester cyclase
MLEEGEQMAEPKMPDSTSPPTALSSRGTESRPAGVGRVGQRPTASAAPSALRIPRELMPQDFSISLHDSLRGGTDRMLLHPGTDRRQPMRGFDARYVDIIDYIVRITHRIWEEKNVGYIYDVYRHNCRVTDDAGLQYGRDKIVADTVHTINAFPDIRLYADEIVWAGDEEVGFFTSHRTVITGTNTGWSRFGPPTNRRMTVWCIANCLSQDNEIFEEWVIYNQSSMLRQLGFDLAAKAREFGNQRIRSNAPSVVPTEPTRLEGQGKPRHLAEPPGHFELEGEVRRAHHYAWNWRNLGALDRLYDERLIFHGPTDRELRGLSAYKSFVLSLIAMFPDIASQIDEIYWMGNEAEGYLTSVRWSAVGTHRGFGAYGEPTGRQIRLWGLSQQRIVGGKIREEWLVFNEFDVMQQIFASEPI